MDITMKYRPSSFDEVLGQKRVVSSLKAVLKDRTLLPHAYLFSGPAGVGKTSIARILAKELGCKPFNVIEQDSTLHSSPDSMRELLTAVRIPAMGGNPYRVVILDEVQDLSKQTWDTILKDVEESPSHLFWILCTTEADKFPARLTTRFHPYSLRPLSKDVLKQRLIEIKIEEGYTASDDMLDAIVDKCGGSMRGALTLLSAFRASEDPADAADLGDSPTVSSEMLELVKAAVRGQPFHVEQFIKYNGEELRKVFLWHLTKMAADPEGSMGKAEFQIWREWVTKLSTPLHSGSVELLARLPLDMTIKPLAGFED